MANSTASTFTSFLGTGWSFPPEFVLEAGEVRMTSDEQDIEASLRILFGTTPGERLFAPVYGLDVRELLFEPMSTTLRTFLAERVKIAILFYEGRIEVLSLQIESPDPNNGTLRISLDYAVRSTNSRYNLVFPFYLGDGNEARAAVGLAGT
ncbi:MAG: GPW/gp25 family protein [Byssovorax sp.]